MTDIIIKLNKYTYMRAHGMLPICVRMVCYLYACARYVTCMCAHGALQTWAHSTLRMCVHGMVHLGANLRQSSQKE